MRIGSPFLLIGTIATMISCGGGDDGGGGGSSTPPSTTPISNVAVSTASANTNTARLADLNALRGQCDGTVLATVSSHNGLIVSAVRHAGWQAIDDVTLAGVNLNHNEPRSNALFTATDFDDRIRAGNGGSNIPGYTFYFEDIASSAGATSINQLWNTVYHRIPMMRHRATNLGYGDMAMARADYPSANVPATDEWGNSPAGNGYATLNWAGFSTPAITLSFWPKNLTTQVPRVFFSDQEAPDPIPSRNQVGSPLHLICPENTGEFTVVNITMTGPGAVSVPLYVLAGGTSPSGAAGQVSTLLADTRLARGELFAIPIPTPNNTGLAASATYTYNMQVTVNGNIYNTGNVTFTTTP